MIYFPKIPLKVERIQKEVAEEGMSECFYESGPQSISQMVISLCTGLEKLPQISWILFSVADASVIASVSFVLSNIFKSSKRDSSTQVSQ